LIPAWRVTKRRFADLSGVGGRWNSPGRAVVYLAEHPALAVLEVRVHLDLPPDLIPDDYVMMQVDLPNEPPEIVASKPQDERVVGDAWRSNGRTAVLKVPSKIAPGAWNYLFNPDHPCAGDAKIVDTAPFAFDQRLWTSITE
jgi:RES domain-containing protein